MSHLSYVSVLIPFRPSTPERDRLWDWNRRRWSELFPEVQVCVADDGGSGNPGEFNHPAAMNAAFTQANRPVVVCGDADTAADRHWLIEAVRLVLSDEAPWVLPRWYRKLTQTATSKVLRESVVKPLHGRAVEWAGDSVSWSGLPVVRREAFEVVEGYDERFTHWGADDSSFGVCMDTLWGRHVRLDLDEAAYHLWHPVRQSETYGHAKAADLRRLADRYIEAAGDPDAMLNVRFGIG